MTEAQASAEPQPNSSGDTLSGSTPATSSSPPVIHRGDYRRPDFEIDRVDLRFVLGETVTAVHAKLAIRRAAGTPADAPLVLDGESLVLRELAVDGELRTPDSYRVTPETLTIPGVGEVFELRTVVEIGRRTTPS